MPWRQLFKRSTTDSTSTKPETTQVAPPLPTQSPPTAQGQGRTLPPHMQRIVAQRARPATPDASVRLARLERERLAALYDIEQGELAAAPDNPWQQRIGLLTEAMATVQEDLARAKVIVPGPFHPLPTTPIEGITVELEPVASVSFTIGGTRFHYAEDLDWAERGHQMAQSELIAREGDAGALLPNDVPPDLRVPLRDHLAESLFVFASDLRDRRIDELPAPESQTLAALALPCPVCGGWTDWLGRCQNCRQREARLQALGREQDRLLDERAREAEEQHRLKERINVARRKLRDLDAEIAALPGES